MLTDHIHSVLVSKDDFLTTHRGLDDLLAIRVGVTWSRLQNWFSGRGKVNFLVADEDIQREILVDLVAWSVSIRILGESVDAVCDRRQHSS